GLIRRAVGQDLAGHYVAAQRMDAEDLAVITLRQSGAFILDKVVGEARHAGMLHRLEVAEGERVRERAVFAEALLEIAALDVMEPRGVDAVVSGIASALGVDLQTEGVAAALGEDFVAAGLGVVAPDELAHGVDGRLLHAIVLDMAADRASLGGIEPAVG